MYAFIGKDPMHAHFTGENDEKYLSKCVVYITFSIVHVYYMRISQYT